MWLFILVRYICPWTACIVNKWHISGMPRNPGIEPESELPILCCRIKMSNLWSKTIKGRTQHHRASSWAPRSFSVLGLLRHTFSASIVSQKVLCLGFVRGNGIAPRSFILLLYMYISLLQYLYWGGRIVLFLASNIFLLITFGICFICYLVNPVS